MNLLRSICCLFAGPCAGEVRGPTERIYACLAQKPTLAKRKPSLKRPAKRNSDTWKAVKRRKRLREKAKHIGIANRIPDRRASHVSRDALLCKHGRRAHQTATRI